MTDKDIIAVVMPDGSLQIEWTDSSEAINKSRSLLQKEIYKRFLSDTDSWLLFLGFSDSKVSLSESLEFWRKFVTVFTGKLSKTPDLEDLRENVGISITLDEIEQHLNQAPMMTGSDYLNAELLADIWTGLNDDFRNLIQSFDGSTAEFMQGKKSGSQSTRDKEIENDNSWKSFNNRHGGYAAYGCGACA